MFLSQLFYSVFFLCALLINICFASFADNVTDRVVASVDGHPIFKSDLIEKTILLKTLQGQDIKNPEIILKHLIEEKIILVYKQKNEIAVSESDIEGRLVQIFKQLKGENFSKEHLNSAIVEMNVSKSSLYNEIDKALTWDKIIIEKILPQIVVKDDEIANFLETINSSKQMFLKVQFAQADAKYCIQNKVIGNTYQKDSNVKAEWLSVFSMLPEIREKLLNLNLGKRYFVNIDRKCSQVNILDTAELSDEIYNSKVIMKILKDNEEVLCDNIENSIPAKNLNIELLLKLSNSKENSVILHKSGSKENKILFCKFIKKAQLTNEEIVQRLKTLKLQKKTSEMLQEMTSNAVVEQSKITDLKL